MGACYLYLITLIMILVSLATIKSQPQSIKSPEFLDLLIRNYTFKSYSSHFKTGMINRVDLPSNFSGILVSTVMFRSGSLYRYGARINEFNLGIGVTIQPMKKRVVLISQNLGYNWSSLYYNSYKLSGYKIVSPILGLLAYNFNYNDPFEIEIQAAKSLITIDFTNTTLFNKTNTKIRPLCASFANDKVTFETPRTSLVCTASRDGHYGLVIKSSLPTLPPPPPPPLPAEARKKIGLWKVIVGSTIGSILGVVLLGMLLVAMLVKEKEKARIVEMERRFYEEEALQVSMVGHVRAPIGANGTNVKYIY